MSHISVSDDPVALLQQLVAIPSVNPMGRDVAGPEFLETRLTAALIAYFQELGVPHERIEVAEGRANVIARFDRQGASHTVLLDAHQDTVPTDGMTIAPFDPVIKDGRLYGRGACDVKGGMAAMLAAFVRLVREQPADSANVVLSCTCDEESTSTGIRDLCRLWSDPDRAGSLLSEPPDVAVVAEPTGLDVVVAHRGASRWKIVTSGRACHSSEPANGINAIYRMATVLKHLEDYADELSERVPAHPLCGPATLSVGRIEGGVSVNTVPDACAIEIDRRCLPGEDSLKVIDDVRTWLETKLDFPIEFEPPWLVGEPLSDELNGPLADRLLACIAAVAGPHEKLGVPYGTHASRTATAGVPSVVFGPGSIEQAHTKDEWISIEQLQQAGEVYFQFCANGGAANS